MHRARGARVAVQGEWRGSEPKKSEDARTRSSPVWSTTGRAHIPSRRMASRMLMRTSADRQICFAPRLLTCTAHMTAQYPESGPIHSVLITRVAGSLGGCMHTTRWPPHIGHNLATTTTFEIDYRRGRKEPQILGAPRRPGDNCLRCPITSCLRLYRLIIPYPQLLPHSFSSDAHAMLTRCSRDVHACLVPISTNAPPPRHLKGTRHEVGGAGPQALSHLARSLNTSVQHLYLHQSRLSTPPL